MNQAIQDTISERARQEAKWGEQNHNPITWSAILTEECGEFAQAALHHKFGGPAAASLRNEAVQVAAVAVAIIEYIDRNADNCPNSFCNCENPGPHFKPGSGGKFCAVCGKDIQQNAPILARPDSGPPQQ